jgi:hypothetical protein
VGLEHFSKVSIDLGSFYYGFTQLYNFSCVIFQQEYKFILHGHFSTHVQGEVTTFKHLVDSKIESKIETLHACVGG